MNYEFLPSFLLGFHGTDQVTAEKILSGEELLAPSKNSYDWLGHGIYFWEYSPLRALEFAGSKYENPVVIGAVIDPGFCLNLLEASALNRLKGSYELLVKESCDLPENVGGVDKLQRHLDCAVIESLHVLRESGEVQRAYDTVRGAFWEGEELYSNAGFKEKNHVQIVVRNLESIKGYFRVID
jgi:hypothetical protein